MCHDIKSLRQSNETRLLYGREIFVVVVLDYGLQQYKKYNKFKDKEGLVLNPHHFLFCFELLFVCHIDKH